MTSGRRNGVWRIDHLVVVFDTDDLNIHRESRHLKTTDKIIFSAYGDDWPMRKLLFQVKTLCTCRLLPCSANRGGQSCGLTTVRARYHANTCTTIGEQTSTSRSQRTTSMTQTREEAATSPPQCRSSEPSGTNGRAFEAANRTYGTFSGLNVQWKRTVRNHVEAGLHPDD